MFLSTLQELEKTTKRPWLCDRHRKTLKPCSGLKIRNAKISLAESDTLDRGAEKTQSGSGHGPEGVFCLAATLPIV